MNGQTSESNQSIHWKPSKWVKKEREGQRERKKTSERLKLSEKNNWVCVWVKERKTERKQNSELITV